MSVDEGCRSVMRIDGEQLRVAGRPWGLPNHAFVTRGDPAMWPSLGWVTPANLRARFAETPFAVYGSGQEQRETARRTTNFRDYVDYLERPDTHPLAADCPGERLYLGEHVKLPQTLGILGALERYAWPLVPRAARLARASAFWMGPEGSRSGLHADPNGLNIVCQLFGHKRVYVVPPREGARITRSRRFDDGAHTTDLDLWQEPGPGAPWGAEALDSWWIDVGPGDLLYIPRFWWHAVENTSVSVAVSYRAETPLSAVQNLGTYALDALHALGLYRRGNCTCHAP